MTLQLPDAHDDDSVAVTSLTPYFGSPLRGPGAYMGLDPGISAHRGR